MASLQNEWNRGVGHGKNAHLNSVCTLQFYISTPPALFYYALVKGSLIQIIAICLWFSCTFAFWGTLFRNPQNNLYVDFNERHLFAWYSAPILTIENSWEKSLYIMLTSISRTWLSIERTFFLSALGYSTWLCGLFLPFFWKTSIFLAYFSRFLHPN